MRKADRDSVFEYEFAGIDRKISVSVGSDPGVIEVQVSPMTLAEWKLPQVRRALQSDLFDLATSHGLQAHPFEGGGHVNVGYQYLAKNPDLFVALQVDLANHPELAMGGFGIYDPEDALSLSELAPKYRRRFAELVRDYRPGETHGPGIRPSREPGSLCRESFQRL